MAFGEQIQISDFQFAEVVFAAEVSKAVDVLTIHVPLFLQERRIFLYLEVKQSVSGPYLFDCEVNLKRGSTIRGRFPAKIAELTGATGIQSIPSLLNAGGSPVGDSLVLRLAVPFDAAVPSVVIQPLRVNGEVDRITLNVNNVAGSTLTGYRAYLACLSTKY